MICDGCLLDVPTEVLAIFAPEGLQVRYCRDCTELWRALERALNAETDRLQALNRIFQEEIRCRCPLKVTPLDFPAVVRNERGDVVTLR